MPALSHPDNLLAVFDALPGPFLLLSPELRIAAVSDSYLAATLTRREQLLGQYIFEAFPDNPATPEAQGSRKLRASLEQVLATAQPHEMARQHYDVPDPARPGQFVERHWLPRNIPVLNEQGRVQYILHAATDVTNQVRDERKLQSSQHREQHALAEAEAQRHRLHSLLAQAPALIVSLRGPEHHVELANDNFRQLFGHRELVGRPYAEAAPELVAQGFLDLIDQVYRSGETYYGSEVPALIESVGTGRPETRYFNFIYQATRDAAGAVEGVLLFGFDVSEQIRARRLVENQEQHTNQLNEELAAANEEIRASNEELLLAEQQLRELNLALEQRVAERTTQAQAAQLEAERQRARLQRFFMQAPAAICVLDGPELVFELVNPGYQALFPGRQLLGRPLLAALPEIAGHEVYRSFRAVFETGLTHREENLLIPLARPDGGELEDRYFTYIQQARYDEHGHIDGMLVFAFEVTEQARARQQAAQAQAAALAAAEQLAAQRETFYQVFAQTPASIAILRGPEHRFEYVNPGYQQLFPGRRLLGRPLAEALPETIEFGFVALLNRVFETGEPFFGTELPLQVYSEEGELLPTAYFTFTYQAYQEQGRTVGVSIFAFEVSEQVRTRREAAAQLQASNAELAASNQRLRRTNQDLDNFVYAASHDLKQPVNNLRGLLDELLRSVRFLDPAEEQLLVPLIQDGLSQLSVTINDLAELGQAQQVQPVPAELVSLDDLTEEVVNTLEPQVRAARARVSTNFSACPLISFPRANLRTILHNLLGNSLKYADPTRPALIRVAIELEAGQPVLVVADNGLGFDSARYGEELFSLFRRFHSHTPGTGVGLYLVNRIVQANGGSVEVESQPGAGATFRVKLGIGGLGA